MKTLRIINEKHFIQEEIKLSPSDIELAIKEFLESRFSKFQRGWNISVENAVEANVVCSKWAGFSCPKCNSLMTTINCSNQDCNLPICEKNETSKKCCACLGN